MSPRTPSAATTRNAVVVTPHHLASNVALDVMHSGGNAMDAAVAANAVLGTVLPTTCGIGGDLFALVLAPDKEVPDALNASGRGGQGLDAEAIRAGGNDVIPLSDPRAITSPGCVDGWVALLKRHGTRPLAEALAPALGIARDGFDVSVEFAAALADIQTKVEAQPSAPELYPLGRSPVAGETIRRPRYAAVLQSIAEDGRDAFYKGPVADSIVAASGASACEDRSGCNRKSGRGWLPVLTAERSARPGPFYRASRAGLKRS